MTIGANRRVRISREGATDGAASLPMGRFEGKALG